MTRYYGIDAANERIGELRPVLEQLRSDRDAVAAEQRDLEGFRRSNGSDDHAAELTARESRIRTKVKRMQRAVEQIESWDVTLRDIDAGLVDFPALSSGRPIWLCWRLGEGDIEWWHEVTEGYSNRHALIDLI